MSVTLFHFISLQVPNDGSQAGLWSRRAGLAAPGEVHGDETFFCQCYFVQSGLDPNQIWQKSSMGGGGGGDTTFPEILYYPIFRCVLIKAAKLITLGERYIPSLRYALHPDGSGPQYYSLGQYYGKRVWFKNTYPILYILLKLFAVKADIHVD